MVAFALASPPVVLAWDGPGKTLPSVPVAVDIRPGICPNHLRIQSPVTISIAVLGTAELDVTNIDPTAIRVSCDGVPAECEPTCWAYADVGFPVIGSSPDCAGRRGDGLDDLALSFSIPDLVRALGLAERLGETVQVNLTGKLVTGQEISGSDCVVVMEGYQVGEGLDGEIGLLACPDGESGSDELKFGYYTNTSDEVHLVIYDVRGRVVARLVDDDLAPGIYHATWTRADREEDKVGPGTYFARVTNSLTGATKKFTLP